MKYYPLGDWRCALCGHGNNRGQGSSDTHHDCRRQLQGSLRLLGKNLRDAALLFLGWRDGWHECERYFGVDNSMIGD